MKRKDTMPVETLEAKAHELIGQMSPSKLPAVVHLLEAMVHDGEEDEDLIPGEAEAVARSKEWFQHNEGIPFEQIVDGLGLTMEEIRAAAGKVPAA